MVVSPKYPGMHRHCASDDDMGLDLEFDGHGFAIPLRHQTDALQGEQSPPFGPSKPPLHTQACNSLDPWKELELSGQDRQTLARLAPMVSE